MIKQLRFFTFVLAITLIGCQEDSFVETNIVVPQAPTGLKYASVVSAREFGVVITAPPTYNSYGAIPVFEIVAVRDSNGTVLNQSDVDAYFSILNATEETVNIEEEDGTIIQYKVLNTDDIGRIRIDNNNPLAEGKYYFDIKMISNFDNQFLESTFANVFELYLGPALASGLLYIPGGQNLLTSGNNKTTEPIVFGANPDYRFVLADNQDKFSIDSSTGVITLNSGYSPLTEPEIVSPTINIISNISEEVVSFSNVVSIYISNNPVVIPKQTIQLFYPTFEFENTTYGFRIHDVVNTTGLFWQRLAPAPGALVGDDRPAENVNQKRLEVNIVRPSGGNQVPHESWAIMNSVDLTAYQFGFDVETEFFSNNQFVEYLSTDGSSPSFMKAYISTDYLGDFNSATWTEITDQLESNIESGGVFIEGNEFMGYPYPGDQNLRDFPNPDGLKDPAKNADNKWIRSTFNMADYVGMSNVTVAFRVHTTFEGSISYVFPFDRSGRYLISDFNITAYEQ
ncbi:hypothetical protein V8G56_02050 [Gaetbulibacter aquiaggeris]|uniref:Uncharacterized protein n=1 Tax=Gaetbulibacter aquiaggeris TaxID=1735373 RepID=A0ABW7MNU2_9FLAO